MNNITVERGPPPVRKATDDADGVPVTRYAIPARWLYQQLETHTTG